MATEITSANVAQAIVKLVAAEVMESLVGNLVMGNLVNRNFEPELAQSGDTINVPLPPTLTANNVAEAGSVTNQNPGLGNAQIVLNTHSESTFVIPDVTKAIAHPDLMKTYLGAAVNAQAESIETNIFKMWPLLGATASVGTANTAITEAVIDSAETALFVAKVPPAQPRFLAVNGATYGTLRQIGRFSEMLTYGNGVPIQTGQVLQLKGFNVFRSQYVDKVSTTTHNLAFGPDCFGLAMRRLPQALPGTGVIQEYVEKYGYGLRVTMSYQAGILSQAFTVDCLYGVGLLRATHGLQVLS